MNALDSFNSLLLDISKGLSGDNLKELKFLCSDIIGKKRLEGVKSGVELFQCLKEQSKIGSENTTFLRELLKRIQRDDLADKVPPCAIVVPKSSKEEEKLSTATEFIAENLGKDWKRFARKLGLKEAHLDNIQRKHSCDLREQVIEAIKLWREIADDPQASGLVKALRDCQLNWTAESLEKELADKP